MEAEAWNHSIPFLWTLATGIAAAAFAAGAVKRTLNGTKDRVKEIHEQLHAHITEEHNADQQTHERIARVETKIDLLLSRVLQEKMNKNIDLG